MSTTARAPRGTATGGQFVRQTRPEARLALVAGAPDRQHLDHVEHRLDPDFGLPQTHDLEKVVLAVDAVANGVNTQDAIAEALGIHPREGGYCVNAAGYLGLVDVDKSDGIHAYRLTPAGQAMAEADDLTRAEMLTAVVASMPAARAYVTNGRSGLEAEARASGLHGATVTRRANAVRAWVQALGEPTRLAERIAESRAVCQDRFTIAAAGAQVRIATARSMRRAEPTYRFCDGCFMALPTNGECDNCNHAG